MQAYNFYLNDAVIRIIYRYSTRFVLYYTKVQNVFLNKRKTKN